MSIKIKLNAIPSLKFTFTEYIESSTIFLESFSFDYVLDLLQLNYHMTSEAISKQVETEDNSEITLNIHFKQRSTIRGLFIKGNDYKDLRSKNLWRIVTNANIELWKKTKDANLARIFNGIEFTRLSDDN